MLSTDEKALIMRLIEIGINEMQRVDGEKKEQAKIVEAALIRVRLKLKAAWGAGGTPAIGQPRQDASQATH